MSSSWRAYLAEMAGTYLLVFFGPASVVVASRLDLAPFVALLFVAAVFGSTVGSVILAMGWFSGAQINPAVSMGIAVAGRMRWGLFPFYVCFQALGGLLAGFTLRVVFGPGTNLGSTQLRPGITLAEGLMLEIVGTFFLALSALTAGSFLRSRWAQALLVGGTLFTLILYIGPLTGASFNPARSLGPSVFSGYYTDQGIYYLGPVAGAAVAGLVFGALRRDR